MMQKNKFMQMAMLVGAFAFTNPFGASAQDDLIHLGFDTGLSNNSINTPLTEEDGVWTILTTGGDPYVGLTALPRDLREDERVLKFEYKSNKDIGIEIFFSTSTGSSFAAGYSLVLGTAPATTEWESVSIDLATPIDEWKWGKQNYTMRFDPGNEGGIIFQVRNVHISTDKIQGADLSKYNFTMENGIIQINNQNDFDTWTKACNDFISSLYVPNMNVSLNTDVKLEGSKASAIEVFRGTLEGNGHTITMDLVNNEKSFGLGFVHYLEGTLRNLTFTGKIEGNSTNVGPVAMDLNDGGLIENVFCDVNIITSGVSNDYYLGGITARAPVGAMRNVIYAGTITSVDASITVGGIMGNCGSTGKTICENVIMAGKIEGFVPAQTHTICSEAGNVTPTNIYVLDGSSYEDTPGWVTGLTAEELASGRFAFEMNGDQSNIVWRQTIGTDPMPTMNKNSKQVFAAGKINCDGSYIGDINFNNESGSSIPDHEYDEDGHCVNCGAKDPNHVQVLELEQDEEGNYLINNGEELMLFARSVNNDESFRRANAKLTDDVDLSGYDWTPIGWTTLNYGAGQAVSEIGYAGTFDGQGHIIYNAALSEEFTGLTSGIFGTVTGAIRNLGVSGYTVNRVLGGRHAAMVGVLVGGTIDNSFVIDSEVVHPTNGEIFSMMAAGNYGGVITNCFEAGNTIENYPRAGMLVGDNRDDNSVRQGKVVNCYSEQFVTGDGRSGGYGGGKTNCEDHVSIERFESGEIAYKLNGSKFSSNPLWRQEIGNGYPSLNPEYPIVVVTPAGTTMNVSAENGLSEFASAIAEEEADFTDDLICQKALGEEYIALVESLEDDDFTEESFAEVLKNITNLRGNVASSVKAYENYEAKVEEVLAYLDEHSNFDGEWRTILENYFTETVEPDSALYPNGSYAYIMEERLLDNKGLDAEKAFIQSLLDKAIATGYQEGADVTNLMTNADFSNGTTGWTQFKLNITTVAGAMNAGQLDVVGTVSQTISELRPGFYKLTAFAAYRADDNNNSTNQASFVFAGDTKAYASVLSEGVLPADIEDAGKYTALTDIEGNITGYVATNATQMGHAFAAGLFKHVLVAEVGEDGTLTVGVHTPGCNAANVTWVGPMTLTYLGDAESSILSAALDETMECQKEHLNTLTNDYPAFCADTNNPNSAPNLPAALLGEISGMVEGTCGPSVAQKLERVAAYSNFAQEAYDAKMAYTNLMAMAEVVQVVSSEMNLAGMITEAEANILDDAYAKITEGYLDGTFSKQEAEEFNPFNGISFVPAVENDVIKIGTAKELIMFSCMINGGMNQGMNAELTADIDMAGIDFYPPIAFSDPNHKGSKATDLSSFILFTGVFDGKGHSIKNLTAAYNANYWASGVFGNNAGTIRNLIVDNYTFTFGDRAEYEGRHAALCGVNFGTIENCAVINSTVVHTNEIVSGMVAGNYDGLVRACFEANNNINPYQRAGMLVGDNRDDNNARKGTVKDCFSSRFVTGEGRTNPYLGTQINNTNNCGTFHTGEVAYLLNQYNEGYPECMTWKQTMGEDMTPVLDQSHMNVLKTADGYSNYEGFNNELFVAMNKANSMIETLTATGAEAGIKLITEPSQVTANCVWPANASQFPATNMADGDINTYFHSDASNEGQDQFNAENSWFQVNLKNAIVGFDMEYWGRFDGGPTVSWHDVPNKFRILGSNTPDVESSWMEVANVEYPEIPNEDGVYFKTSEPIMLGGAYKAIRFVVLHTTSNFPYWNINEFQMYSAGGEGSASYADEHPEIAAPLATLKALCDAAPAKLAAASSTAEDVAEIKEAIKALRALIAGSVIPYEGSKEEPIMIANAEELTNLRKQLKNGNMTYVALANDIDMAEVESWTPLNTTADNYKKYIYFDGQGHVIKNFTCTDAMQQYNSFFGILCGEVHNVGFENVNVSCFASGSGVLAGYMGHDSYVVDGKRPTSIIHEVWATGKLEIGTSYAGGLVGNVGGPSYIKNVYTNLDITSSADATGGIVGRVREKLTITGAYAAGTMTNGGGIIGGGQRDETPAGTYENIVVWNNTDSNFGPTKAAATMVEVPAADLFDLAVTADGTVADKSAKQNNIKVYGDVNVKYNSEFDTYSYMTKANGDAGKDYLKIDYSEDDAMKEALTDGFTMELTFAELTTRSGGRKPFCATEGGGFGIELLDGGNLQMPVHTNQDGSLGYRSINSGVSVVQGNYYHVVAVYNPEAATATIFVNGAKSQNANAGGVLHFPDGKQSQWIGIGADPAGSAEESQAASNFEIVRARIYNDPLTDDQAKTLYYTQFAKRGVGAGDRVEGVEYFNGNNFGDLQRVVVGWGDPWMCGMADGEYPVFDVTKTDIANTVVKAISNKIYNINGIEVEKAENGIFIINGKKVVVK